MEIGNLEKVLRVGEGRRLKRLQEQAAYITSLEPDFEGLSAADLQGKTAEFRQRLENGETLDELDAHRGTAGNRLFYLSTPAEAFAQLKSCLRHAGALKVVAHSDGGGAAFFTRPWVEIPDQKHGWLDWKFKVSGGQVTGISELAYDVHGMSRAHRRAANLCLKPFHAHMWS